MFKKIIFLLFILLVACSQSKDPLNETEKIVMDRYRGYRVAYDSMDYETSYNYLSKTSKENIAYEEWREYVFKNAKKAEPDTIEVIIEPGGKRARVDIESKNKSDNSKSYHQTWVFEDNNWYRAFAEDNKIRKKEPLPPEVIKKPDTKEGIKEPAIQFDITDLNKNWYLAVSSLQKEKIYQPELKFKIKNTGNIDIKYLRLMAVFYEEGKDAIYDKIERYIISTSDIPLAVGHSSETIFLRTGIGYIFNGYNQSTIFNQRFKIKLYYKSNYSEDWQLFKEIDF